MGDNQSPELLDPIQDLPRCIHEPYTTKKKKKKKIIIKIILKKRHFIIVLNIVYL